MGNIVVIGSVNMDMVCSVDKRPEKGETVLGNSFYITWRKGLIKLSQLLN